MQAVGPAGEQAEFLSAHSWWDWNGGNTPFLARAAESATLDHGVDRS